jgi:hypothetical protein
MSTNGSFALGRLRSPLRKLAKRCWLPAAWAGCDSPQGAPHRGNRGPSSLFFPCYRPEPSLISAVGPPSSAPGPEGWARKASAGPRIRAQSEATDVGASSDLLCTIKVVRGVRREPSSHSALPPWPMKRVDSRSDSGAHALASGFDGLETRKRAISTFPRFRRRRGSLRVPNERGKCLRHAHRPDFAILPAVPPFPLGSP